ncbi:MAG: hypothetical protein KatS3mg008_1054 [Acidimicrobiales bacterium]|nr:MAG: hypothetical protein KatS3mg008_1054 [Acidimicrobiales bacterium]
MAAIRWRAPCQVPRSARTARLLFPDVGCGHPFFEPITVLSRDGVIVGTQTGNFEPTSSLTRLQMAIILWRTAGEPQGPFPPPAFSDIPPTHPFITAIAWLADRGITRGYPDGTFRPGLVVTRQEMSAFIHRYLGEPDGPFPDPGFTDVGPDHPFEDAIWFMAELGLALGFGDGTFRPTNPLLRQEGSAFVHRMRELRQPCDPLDPRDCFLPFPSNYFSTVDLSVPNGRRVDLDPSVMPTNDDGVPIDPTEWNKNDGASPGTMMVAYVPGVDLTETGAVPITDMPRYADPDAPVVVIDTHTGERHPIWVELDSHATSDATRALIIRPIRNFEHSHTYVVALRNMKNSAGEEIAPSDVFRSYRDGVITDDPYVEARRGRMERIFKALEAAGIPREDLYLAWDFTVISAENLTGRLLHMRDDAFQKLLEDTAADGEDTSAGGVPDFEVTAVRHDTDAHTSREIEGTYQVPLYLTGTGGPGERRFDPDDDGIPDFNGWYTARFRCLIPKSASKDDPAKMLLFQHGLLGSADSVFDMAEIADAKRVMVCGTDWIGMSAEDLDVVAAILDDLSNFPKLVDRTQQGILNVLVLGRLMRHPDGLVSHGAFRYEGVPLFDNSELAFNGNSQGGILGGAATALATDWQRAVLGVPGMNFSLMLRRSIYWDLIVAPYLNYSDELQQTIGLGFLQMLWDRAESNGYAHFMTDNPLPGTPPHEVMLLEAFGDFQVANIATENMARTIGARLRVPALEEGRSNLLVPFYQIPEVDTFPYHGSVLVVWDFGADPPPTTNTPPSGDFSQDPHVKPLGEPRIWDMAGEFLLGNGLIDVCGGGPCKTP